MLHKEAQARIKIDKLLKAAGWRFFDDQNGTANIQLECNVKIKKTDIDKLGSDFETAKNGRADYILLDDKNFPLVVLEAKSEQKDPLDGKEQARNYAQSVKARFIILSNGNSHYLWDLAQGNPEIITKLPAQADFIQQSTKKRDIKELASEAISPEYIAATQKANFTDDPNYKNAQTRAEYLRNNELRLLRPYQIKAIKALQKSASTDNRRFLFEMATGTGKTLISAAIIKLFLATGNAQRVLFLVDRLELESQAAKNFRNYLQNDYETVIYKEQRGNWRSAEIVVTTVQSIATRYRDIFSHLDFDLIIADESHRAINGNARAVFEYFHSYKLGLTATPKNYLKNVEFDSRDPREWEQRQLRDTYTTFGCQDSEPTYRYSLNDGVADGYLISPKVIDARTEISTELLSEQGYSVMVEAKDGNENDSEENQQTFIKKDFERKFTSANTNREFCKAFINNAERDPCSEEIGKSIVFCVSQEHARKITAILNELASIKWQDKYSSDFAVQITSNIANSQGFSKNFANNNLNGHTNFLENYKSSKTRVCVTVGMMTTGYDCQDILNIVLMRPIFSPTDFIQIKGRGTRKFNFKYQDQAKQTHAHEKRTYTLFDFFANYEYFEKDFRYDEKLEIKLTTSAKKRNNAICEEVSAYTSNIPDPIQFIAETTIGKDGMRIDREFFNATKKAIAKDQAIKEAVLQEQWELAIKLAKEGYENKPELYITLEKIRKAENLDRRLSWREVLERIFGVIAHFKSKDELLEIESDKFIDIYKPENQYTQAIKNYLKAYVGNADFRDIIKNKDYTKLSTNPYFSMHELKKLREWNSPEILKNTKLSDWDSHQMLTKYIQDHINLQTYTVEDAE